ncbi:MAG: amino acid racemase [Syntrophomonadaceae bacterium]|nr:amino acid racemase [Syntrophomonadaceae bacterium]MDD3897660.1 amino acid racemase [Syntrophomonadaceae bacterium]MDD4562253.1 amino acid racemase [Syntrophomonadaceae bacterium]
MWDKEHKILGILGGMGPLATQLFYRQIIERTEASCDQEHVDIILFNHASMPDRTTALLSGKAEELFAALAEDAKRLERYGATAIAIPCNTSHFFADKLQGELSIPIINMIRETAITVANRAKPVSCVGILATDGTINGGLYQKACEEVGVKPIVPSAKTQALVMKIIYEGIKGGRPIDYNDFIAIEGELSANGCEAAVLACTELSCFKEMYRLPDYYIDAMEVLADRAIEACGKRIKKK